LMQSGIYILREEVGPILWTGKRIN